VRGVAGAVQATGPLVREVLTTTANATVRTGGLIRRPSRLSGVGFVQVWAPSCYNGMQ
jgi:hypothetical protein